jgi:hypothetical protein
MRLDIFKPIQELVKRFPLRSNTLQPNGILQELYREMEQKKRLGIDENAFVPNHYVVFLNNIDLEEISPLIATITEQLKKRLGERIKTRGYRLLAPITLEIKDCNNLEMNEIDVESTFNNVQASVMESKKPKQAPLQDSGRQAVNDEGRRTHIFEERATHFIDNTKLKLEVIAGENVGEIISLQSGTFTFGRGRDVKIQLCDEEETISRTHFEISINEGKAYIRDLKSTNGTKVNDIVVADSVEIQTGDTIAAGNVILMVA